MSILSKYPSKYLKGDDVEVGETCLIKEVRDELVGTAQELKPVVYFDEYPKGVILNKTNAKALVKVFGDDEMLWPGKRVVVTTVSALAAKSSAETPKNTLWEARTEAMRREISSLSPCRTRRGGGTRCWRAGRPHPRTRSRCARVARGRATGTCPKGRPARAHTPSRCGRRRRPRARRRSCRALRACTSPSPCQRPPRSRRPDLAAASGDGRTSIARKLYSMIPDCCCSSVYAAWKS